MKNKNKSEIIRKKLFKTGKISRNWCIRSLYFTRLSDLIWDLRNAGHEIETTYADPKDRSSDCVYFLIPKRFTVTNKNISETLKAIKDNLKRKLKYGIINL